MLDLFPLLPSLLWVVGKPYSLTNIFCDVQVSSCSFYLHLKIFLHQTHKRNQSWYMMGYLWFFKISVHPQINFLCHKLVFSWPLHFQPLLPLRSGALPCGKSKVRVPTVPDTFYHRRPPPPVSTPSLILSTSSTHHHWPSRAVINMPYCGMLRQLLMSSAVLVTSMRNHLGLYFSYACWTRVKSGSIYFPSREEDRLDWH